MSQTCKICGRRDKFDFSVPDEIWEQIVPSEMASRVICLFCFDDLAVEKGISYYLDGPLYFAGDAMMFEFRIEREAVGFLNQFRERKDGPGA